MAWSFCSLSHQFGPVARRVQNADSSATMDLENFQPSKFWESNGQSQHNVAIACHCHWGPLRPWLIWIAITVYWHSFTASVEKLLEHGGEAGWSFFQALHKEILYVQRWRENHGKHIRKFLEVLVTFHIHHPFVSYFLLRPQFRPSYPSSIHQISSAAIFFSRCQDGSKSSDACCSWWQKKSQQPRKMAILVPPEIWRNTDQFHQRASTLHNTSPRDSYLVLDTEISPVPVSRQHPPVLETGLDWK